MNIEPMTLGNMRANGVRSLEVSCWPARDRQRAAHHGEVPAIGPRILVVRDDRAARKRRPVVRGHREKLARQGLAPGIASERLAKASNHAPVSQDDAGPAADGKRSA
jgi:hypothetical protein